MELHFTKIWPGDTFAGYSAHFLCRIPDIWSRNFYNKEKVRQKVSAKKSIEDNAFIQLHLTEVWPYIYINKRANGIYIYVYISQKVAICSTRTVCPCFKLQSKHVRVNYIWITMSVYDTMVRIKLFLPFIKKIFRQPIHENLCIFADALLKKIFTPCYSTFDTPSTKCSFCLN